MSKSLKIFTKFYNPGQMQIEFYVFLRQILETATFLEGRQLE